MRGARLVVCLLAALPLAACLTAPGPQDGLLPRLTAEDIDPSLGYERPEI